MQTLWCNRESKVFDDTSLLRNEVASYVKVSWCVTPRSLRFFPHEVDHAFVMNCLHTHDTVL
jgi:hypothetical protein